MPQTGYTPIQLYRSTTAAATPAAGDLVAGELAINLTDEKLYFKNAGGTVKLLASSSSALASVSSVNASGGTTGLTFSGGPITTSGTLTLAGTLGVANGGTGATSLTAGYLVKGNGTSAASASVVYDDGTNVGIGTSSPGNKLDIVGAGSSQIRVKDGVGATSYYDFGRDGTDGFFGFSGAQTTFSGYKWSVNAGTEVMRITNGGNVGIGTSSPKTRLQASAGTQLNAPVLGSANNAPFYVTNNDPNYGLVVGTNAADGHVWLQAQRTDTATAYNITLNEAGGNVGIGTSSPSTKLQVNGAGFTAALISGDSTSETQLRFSGNTAARVSNQANTALIFDTNATERMRIDSSGNVGIGVTPLTRLDVSTSGGSRVRTDTGNSLLVTQTITNAAANAYVTNRTDAFDYQIYTSGSEKMRIDNSGNVGIGTSSPSQKLDVNGSINAGVASGVTLYMADNSAIRNTATGGNTMYFDSGVGTGSTGGDFNFRATASYTSRLYINGNTGNVGIGTSSPGYKLVVNGGDFLVSRGSGAAAADAAINFGGNANNYIYSGNSTNIMAFATNGSERARIDGSGNLLVGKSTFSSATVGAIIEPGGTISSTKSGSTSAASTLEVYSTGASAYRFYVDMAGTIFATSTTISAISDIRLKENVRDLDAGLDTILALKPRRFDWKEGKGKDVKDDMGFIAQEVEEVLPALIGGWKAGEGEPDDLKSVKAGDLIPVLVKAIQELTARVAQLEGN